jgi:flagellar hook assembly protein FlgD
VTEDETLSKRVPYTGLFCIFALLLCVSTVASGQIISNVTIGEFTLSPDGDGSQDSTYIAVTLLDSVFSYDAFILTGDTLSIVDILVDGKPRASGTDSTWWDGENFFGIIVPEGNYLFFVRAENSSGADSLYLEIFVDLTTPQVNIIQIEPSTLIAPGLPDQQNLRIDYFITDSFPTDSVNVNVVVMNPSGHAQDTLTSQLLQIDKTYRTEWDGLSAVLDGIHDVQIRATDNGGHLDVAWAPINVDLDEPSMQITSPDNNKKYKVIPDSIRGWATDRNGITSVEIAYSADRVYEPIPHQWLMNDTLFFAAPLADSITQDGQYQLWFKTSDAAGRMDSLSFNIDLDTDSPSPPVLDPPQNVIHTPNYTLTGTFSQDTEKIRIFRNGAFIDSVFTLLQQSLSEEILLNEGENVITAIAVDEAENTSIPSNAITIVYDATESVFIPQPFRSNDSFQINLSGKTASITLKIFDMGGDLVYAHRDYTLGSNIDIQWNGRNGEGEEVKRGPLVIVVRVEYDNGDDNTLRELFLFNP